MEEIETPDPEELEELLDKLEEALEEAKEMAVLAEDE